MLPATRREALLASKNLPDHCIELVSGNAIHYATA